ncbi:hypothetical protein EW146_g7728 [Bondarzewia mesenterica]|uniref:SAC3/GANP/THP3 conserved domain-containing protein n=1 Tax=Bondarzewia mesenterica TaxID=1095465 RepID=A0A4S4LK15_9AGAM|nr:hypothetical protein EW146_g7728 [Bondarzewia mesenterica]
MITPASEQVAVEFDIINTIEIAMITSVFVLAYAGETTSVSDCAVDVPSRKAREVERKNAIAEGKMDDCLVPKRLDEAITMVGTCMDMHPRFERYRREPANNLFEWELIPGRRRVDHERAVKMYERAAGDKTLPSDLRPPPVLKRTLDYLFHDLLPREGFSPTFNFIRDRSRSVRNDFTMQHETGSLAIECHERCARFHILALHFERGRAGFSLALEEQQLMNTLQSLKEFYEDQHGRYESPNELEMRIYHRLIHIRDQRERHDDIPEWILAHPVFHLTTKFRKHIQVKSEPITKISSLIVDDEAMSIFAELAGVLREQGGQVMVFLVACILERLFGSDTIDDMENIRGGLGIPQIIDGVSTPVAYTPGTNGSSLPVVESSQESLRKVKGSQLKPSATEWLTNNFGVEPTSSAFLGEASYPPVSSSSLIPTSSSAPAIGSIPPSQPAASAFFQYQNDIQRVWRTNVYCWSLGFRFLFPIAVWSAYIMSAPSGLSQPQPTFGGSALGSTSLPGGSFSQSTQPSPFSSAWQASPFGSISAAKPFITSTPPKDALHEVVPSTQPNISPPTFGGAVFGSTSAFGSQSTQSSFSTAASSTSKSTGIFSTPLPNFGVSSSSKTASKGTVSVFGSSSLNPSAPSFTSNVTSNKEAIPSTVKTPLPSQPSPAPFSAISFPSYTPPSVSTSQHTRPSLPPIDTSPPSSLFRPSNVFAATQSETQSKLAFTKPQQFATPPPAAMTVRKETLFELPGLKTSETASVPENAPQTPTIVIPPTPTRRSPPSQPPPVRIDTISLPETPTATAAAFQLPTKPIKSLFGYASLQSVGSVSSEDILSPLQLTGPPLAGRPTPPSLQNRPSVSGSPTPAEPLASTSGILKPSPPEVPSPTLTRPSPPRLNGKGKERAGDTATLGEKASRFLNSSIVVKRSFQRWAARATERAAWTAAVRRSDAYSKRVHRQRLSDGQSANKKRRESNGSTAEPPSLKRSRKRVSGQYVPPRSDDELAQRLKENHEQHERRWAVGSFLELLRNHVKGRAEGYPFDWTIWLSTNSDNDGTAIWVERKFDVPRSGKWATERIFSIPLKSGDETAASPGLLVFECSPLGEVTDEIERKYRILDDCQRLREIIQSLPEDRHFIPSILFIQWAEDKQTNLSEDDLIMMTREYMSEGKIGSYRTFSLTSTTTNLDERLAEVLNSMSLDVSGQLVEILSWKDLLELVISPWNEFAMDWVSRCVMDGEVDWHLYGQVLRTLIELMNILSRFVMTRFDEADSHSDPLPLLRAEDIQSSDTMYEVAFDWSEQSGLGQISLDCALDLQSHQSLGDDFPIEVFTRHLYDIAARRIEAAVFPDKAISYPVPKPELQSIRDDVEKSISKSADKLRRTFAFHVRRKRKAPDEDEADDLHPATPSKRARRLSSEPTIVEDASFASIFNPNGSTLSNGSAHLPPPSSPTVSPAMSIVTEADGSPPRIVTAAMLRALTKNVLKNHAGGRS